jgi:hypothetical protein
LTNVFALEDISACDSGAIYALDLALDLGELGRVVHAGGFLLGPGFLSLVNLNTKKKEQSCNLLQGHVVFMPDARIIKLGCSELIFGHFLCRRKGGQREESGA